MPNGSNPAPDLTIVNADVLTMDPSRPQAQAVAVSQDRIMAVGTTDEVSGLCGPDTQVIDASVPLDDPEAVRTQPVRTPVREMPEPVSG